MTEMSLVEICYRVTNIQKVLLTTKQFSLKFNSHMKLITELVNSIEEIEEENLLLYEEKLEHRADHYHQRIILSQTKEGRDLIKLDSSRPAGARSNLGAVVRTTGIFQTSGGDLRENTKSGILGKQRQSEAKPRQSRWVPGFKRGILSRSTRGRFKLQQSGVKPMNVARSVDEHQVHIKRGRSLSVDERKGVAGMNNSEFVNHLQTRKVPDEEESLHGSMTERFDVFAKENEFLRKIIRSGEENAKHLKDCVFKLIEVFKEKGKKTPAGQTETRKVEHIERVERVNVAAPRKQDEEKTVDIKINHSFLQKEAREASGAKAAALMRENERLKERVQKLVRERKEEAQHKHLAELKEDELEMDLQKAHSQVKLLRREKKEIEDEAEELRAKAKQWKKKYRDEAEKHWGGEERRDSGRGWRSDRAIQDLEEEVRGKARELGLLRGEKERLEKEQRRLAKENEELLSRERRAEGDARKGEERGKEQSSKLEQKDKVIIRLLEYVKELKTTILTLEEEVRRMEREVETLGKNLRGVDFGARDAETAHESEKQLKVRVLQTSKLERRLKHLTQTHNLEKKKAKGKQASLEMQIKHLLQGKAKLQEKVAQLKKENQRKSEIMRTASMPNHKGVLVYESRKSNLNSGKKQARAKYSSQVSKRRLAKHEELNEQNVFREKEERVKSYYKSSRKRQNRGYTQYSSHVPTRSQSYLVEDSVIKRRYPQAPKNASASAKVELFSHQKPRAKGRVLSKSGFVYRVENEEAVERGTAQGQAMARGQEEDEAMEKYVPVYMIGDQYIPVEEYNRLKMLGQIEDDSEEEGEEEVFEDAEGEEEEEEELDEENYRHAIEDYRQQVEEYQVNGYSGEDEGEELLDEREIEPEELEEEGEGGEVVVSKRVYRSVVKQARG